MQSVRNYESNLKKNYFTKNEDFRKKEILGRRRGTVICLLVSKASVIIFNHIIRLFFISVVTSYMQHFIYTFVVESEFAA